MLFTIPASADFTTVVFSAFMSIPVCVVHSSSVFEYIKLSCANSFTISPSTGFEKLISACLVSDLLAFESELVLLFELL